MERKNRIPVNRLSRFYDEVDFQLELDAAKELIEEDVNFTVVLYQVDKIHSNHDVYGESDPNEIRFLAPVELKVLLTIEPADNKAYDKANNRLNYQEYGNLVFTVMTDQLEEKKCDINIGDIVGYADSEKTMKFFEVSNAGRMHTANQQTHFGYKGYFRQITCTTADPNQFNGI